MGGVEEGGDAPAADRLVGWSPCLVWCSPLAKSLSLTVLSQSLTDLQAIPRPPALLPQGMKERMKQLASNLGMPAPPS